MIAFENTQVAGWEAAIRGMRNPMNSWGKSDSYHSRGMLIDEARYEAPGFYVGPNDLSLMMKLRNAGTDHRKFMRMITVYVDITAPLYWWKEFDTYRAGVKYLDDPNPFDIEMNSCSTMHTIHKKEFVLDDFSHEHLSTRETDRIREDGMVQHNNAPYKALESTICQLNISRNSYLRTKDKKYWWQMIQLLPTSYNQKRTVMMNYEVLANIYESRKGHRLDELTEFRRWIFAELPYSELITGCAESISG